MSEFPDASSNAEKSCCTILVAGVFKDYEDALEALVSNRRRGGGAISNYQYDDEHELAWITFEESTVADNFLKAGVITLQGHEMRVLPPSSSRTLYMRNVSNETSELLEILLESSKHGGGPISYYNFDASSQTVTASFQEEEVAQGLLEKKFIKVRDKEIFFSKIPPEALLPPSAEEVAPEPDKTNSAEPVEEEFHYDEASEDISSSNADRFSRTICIQNVPSDMIEFLEIVLTQEKTGGGSIEDMVPDGNDVMVTFEDPAVAKKFLDAGKVNFGKKEFPVLLPPESFLRTTSEVFEEESENKEEQLPSAKVLVGKIPSHIGEDFLLMILEREEDGGGIVVDLQYTADNGQAIVQFEDYRVAQSLLEAGRFRFKQTVLEISPVVEKAADAKVVDSVEIRNIPKAANEFTLKLFLENKRRSGGGEIAELNFDEVNRRAVVKFSDPDVAKSLIEKKTVQYTDGSTLEICLPSSSLLSQPSGSSETSDSLGADILGKVWISEIPAGTKRETLMMFLENKRRSGGGETVEEEFDYDEESGNANVKFKDPAVAEEMIRKGELMLGKNVLKVRKPSSVELGASTSNSRDGGKGAAVESPPVKSRTVEIRGCVKDLSKDSICLWFENKRSGGGPVDSIQILSDDLAVVVFCKAEDAARVAEKRDHVVSKVKLTASLLDSWPDVGGPRAIRVQGFKSGTSKDVLEMYFENERRSGGDEFEELFYDVKQLAAVITYHKPQVVQSVLSRNHSLDGSNLTVEELKPARPPPLLNPADVDSDKLLFTELDPENAAPKKLHKFAELAGKAPVKKITYSSFPGVALVQFSGKPDYEHVKTIVCCRPFRGKMISVQQVPVTKCIQVHSIGKTSQEGLELYFESTRKSGGGPLQTLEFVEGSHSILEFADRDVLDRVLSKKHTLSQQDLDVQIYCTYLGIFPPGFDGSSPVPSIPPDFTVNCSREILRFFLTSHHKKYLEHNMKKRKCFLIWPHAGKSHLTLRCEIKPNDPNTFQLRQKWKENCESFLSAEIEKVKFAEICILGDVWKAFKDKVNEKKNPDERLLLVDFDDQRHILFYSGLADEAEKFRAIADGIKNMLEEELDRSKREIKDAVALKPHHSYLVKISGFLDRYGKDVTVEESGKGFSLRGQPQAVRQAKLQIFEFASSNMHEKLSSVKPTSDAFVKVLDKDAVKNHIHECFINRKILATYEVHKNDIMLYSIDRTQLDAADSLLTSEIVEKSLNLDAAMKEVLEKKEWMKYKAGLARDYPFMELSQINSSIVYVSKESDILAISQRIADFFSGNALYEHFISLPAGKMDLVTRYLSSELDKLKENLKSAEVKTCPPGSGKCGILIRAKKPALKQAEDKVNEFLKSVLSKDHRIENQGAVKFIQSQKGKIILQGINGHRNVVINFADEEQDNNRGKRYSDPVVYVTAHLARSPGKAVKLVLGDITKNRTDTVVNAANSKLEHDGGVARAIANAGDPGIAEICRKRVNTLGEVRAGTVFVTSAGGSLPHKSVIHTVGPVWNGGRTGEERDLELAVSAALQEAEKRAYKSVSLPFISTGIFNFPEQKAAFVIVKSIRDFLTTSISVKEVHVVNGLQGSLDIFQSTLSQFSTDFALVPSLLGASVRQEKSQKKPPTLPRRGTKFPNQMQAGGADTFQTPEGLSISIVRGSIASAKVDAIFNSAEKDLNLSRTAISKCLLLAAGSGLQGECQASWPQGIGFGNVVKTGAHKIPCKAIYHGACVRWDNGAGGSEKIIRKLVSDTLQLAAKDGMTSLAFPAVGTGIKLRTPSSAVAHMMIDEVIKYSGVAQNTSLKQIQFVIYEKDLEVLSAFEKEVQSSGRGRQTNSAPGNDNSDGSAEGEEDDGSDDSDEEEEEQQNQEDEEGDANDSEPDDDASAAAAESDDKKSSGYGHNHGFGRRGSGWRARGHRSGRTSHRSSSASAHSGVTGLDSVIGNLKFLVNCEDITRSSADAIVNGTNDRFNLKIGKLSRAILHAAGDKIQQECLQGKLNDGIALSSGGRLSCKNIFHITAQDAKGWKSAIGRVLRQADAMQLTSIAIPPVGVGRGSVKIKELAEAIFEEVDDFSQTRPQSLQTITLSILDHVLLEEFISVIEKAMSLQGKPFQKFKEKVSEKLKTFFSGDDGESATRRRSAKPRRTSKSTRNTNHSKLTLRIFGLNMNSIDLAIADIKEHCKETKSEQVLQGEDVKEAIAKLTTEQERRIKTVEQQCSVKIIIKKNPGSEKIKLICEDGGDIATAVTEIYNILLGMLAKERNSRELELFAKQAIWQYLDGDTYKKYGTYATGTIEKAHHKRETELEYVDSKRVKHKINFKDMTDERSPGGKVTIKRTVPGSLNLPSRWHRMKPDENSLAVKLDPNSEEYKKVAENLKKTDQGTVKTIIQIDRIQNPTLYRQYMNRKMDMDRTNTKQENERRLWHGTNGTNVVNINNRNFNRSYCGQHGVAIGNGVYFATGANYSVAGYCPADGSGHKHIYQARVLTGQFCQGQPGLKEAPPLPGRTDVTYDSVVNSPTNPAMFVVFLDYQTYPEYHITFT